MHKLQESEEKKKKERKKERKKEIPCYTVIKKSIISEV